MNIYYYQDNYPEKRCIINKIKCCSYRNIRSKIDILSLIDKCINGIIYRFSIFCNEKTLSTYYFLKRKGVIHSFNYCISGGNKWIVSFESVTPRTNSTRGIGKGKKCQSKALDIFTRCGLDLLASHNCLALIALSECTKKNQLRYLSDIAGDYNIEKCHAIAQKTIVLHPPQELLTDESSILAKYDAPILNFIFVGNDFFRKGGQVIVDVLSKYAYAHQFHLTVVSDLSFDDYATNSTENDKKKYSIILDESPWISWYSSIDNDDVLAMCTAAHIGLLPTFADTYGYSVLEMQAAGCPVISTDIRALPEINNNDCGWLLHLPHDDNGEAFYSTPEEISINYKTVYEQLDATIRSIFMMPRAELCSKALASYQRIKNNHDPAAYSNMLLNIIQPSSK